MALLVMTVPVTACGDDDGASAPGVDPPWGLPGIEMPGTEAEVIEVLQALPAIDGRRPVFGVDEDFGYPFVTYFEYEEDGETVWVGISAAPEPDPPAVFPDGWNAAASTAVTGGDLLWLIPDDFGLIWAASNGSWMFYLVADTAEFRVRLVDAFVAAAG